MTYIEGSCLTTIAASFFAVFSKKVHFFFKKNYPSKQTKYGPATSGLVTQFSVSKSYFSSHLNILIFLA